MTASSLIPQIEDVLKCRVTRLTEVGGGDINFGFCVEAGANRYFMKTPKAPPRESGLYLSERWGLERINDEKDGGNGLLAPEVVASDNSGDEFLILNWMDLTGYGDWSAAGSGLKELHKNVQSKKFGFSHRLFIGSCSFEPFESEGLGDLYFEGLINPLKKQVLDPKSESTTFSDLFSEVENLWREELNSSVPRAELIHGDLWSGNIAFLDSGVPVVFDPASYYGFGEIDVAMTEVFGQFPGEFYEAYFQSPKQRSDYQKRRSLWQILPYLVHLYLFGGSYLSSVDRVLRSSLNVT